MDVNIPRNLLPEVASIPRSFLHNILRLTTAFVEARFVRSVVFGDAGYPLPYARRIHQFCKINYEICSVNDDLTDFPVELLKTRSFTENI